MRKQSDLLSYSLVAMLTVGASVFAARGLQANVCGNPCAFGCSQCQTAVTAPIVQRAPICRGCAQQQCQCTPQMNYHSQVKMVPQVQTQPVVTYRDVARTEYRLQPQTETVPVTTYRQVTVDEGHWQRIWVPKPVTKQIPQVTYQQRTTYRQVPYQVTQRVPQVTYQQRTTMVPTVSHHPQITTACNTCGSFGYGSYPATAYAAPTYAYSGFGAYTYGIPTTAYSSGYPNANVASPVMQQPVQLGREILPLDRRSASATEALTPVPEPKELSRPRTAASYDEWPGRVESGPVRSSQRVQPRVSTKTETPIRTSSANSRFVPAPSAISVWRSRDTRLR